MHEALIHLICGSTGAGKSTYAIQLTQRLGAVRFSIDEWMATLYWMDSPTPIEATWAMERVERCQVQIWATASAVALRGIPCVLDLGFSQRESRSRFVSLAHTARLRVQLHLLDVPAEQRWRRVEARNAGSGDTRHLHFNITREMFDFVEGLWEPPTDDEMLASNGVWVA